MVEKWIWFRVFIPWKTPHPFPRGRYVTEDEETGSSLGRV